MSPVEAVGGQRRALSRYGRVEGGYSIGVQGPMAKSIFALYFSLKKIN